ncbi:SLC13 family permease [Hominifimenecus sp. rT4P-3]|uniref:SLC13 family permease n=1 Tax=Hominifimenecus sp. rT4P-3 TaxID=3242979 RepID=UPI003DA584D4
MNKRLISILAALACIIGFRFLPPPAGMNAYGMEVVGILLGAIIFWLAVDVGWPSVVIVAALMVSGFNTAKGVLAGSYGNWIIPFLICTFLVTYALSKTPFLKRCAIFFITTPIAKKGPWYFVAMFFASVIFLGAFMSPSVLFIVFLPIVEEINRVLKQEKGSRIGQMMMMGLVFSASIGAGITPISHVFPLAGMSVYESMTGQAISYANYMAFGIPCGIVMFLVMLLMFKLVYRADLKEIEGVDASELKKALPPVEMGEKISIAVTCLVVFLWLAPDILKSIAPAAASAISDLGTAFPPMLGASLLAIFTYKGKPLLNFNEGMQKGVPWGSVIMCTATNVLGSALTNEEVGLSAFLTEKLSPVASGLAPVLIIAFFLLWAMIQTNLSSNIVTITICSTIAIPIAMASSGALNTPALVGVICAMGSFAFATPPGHANIGIAAGTGWASMSSFVKYGALLGLLGVLVLLGVGYPIASMVM